MYREMRIRNYSERTIKTYISAVGQVARYFNLPPSQFKAHLYHLVNKKNCSVSKINQNISAWKILQQDILDHKWESIRIKRPRREKKLPVVLSMYEAKALINAPNNQKHRTLLTLAYATGVRRNELLNITLKDLCNNPRFLGAQTGAVAVLHTWSSTMTYHPHVHMLVPAGGLSDDAMEWIKAKDDFLVPVKVLSKIYRARFCDKLK